METLDSAADFVSRKFTDASGRSQVVRGKRCNKTTEPFCPNGFQTRYHWRFARRIETMDLCAAMKHLTHQNSRAQGNFLARKQSTTSRFLRHTCVALASLSLGIAAFAPRAASAAASD